MADQATSAKTAVAFNDTGPQVKSVQETLSDLGYDVGNHDGIFGPLTRAAVLAFQADNGLGLTGAVDQETWDAFKTAQPRALSRSRVNITASELAALGSTTIRDGNRTKVLGWIAGVLGVLGIGTGAVTEPETSAGTESTSGDAVQGALEKLNDLLAATPANVQAVKAQVAELEKAIENARDTASPIGNGLEALVQMASEILPGVPGGVLALVIGFAAQFLGSGVIQSRLADHRDAANLGR